MTYTLDRRSLLSGVVGSSAALALSAAAAPPRFFARVGLPIGIQLYALGPEAQRDVAGTFQKLAEIGYREIELPSLMGKTPAELRMLADRTGLGISSIHTPVSGQNLTRSSAQQIADMAGTLGAKQVVVPMFALPAGFKFQPGASPAAQIADAIRGGGADTWKRLADLLNERAALLRQHGIALGYHNHSPEFIAIGSETGFDILAARTDPALVHFEVDIGWVVSAGVNPVSLLNRYRGRCRQVHVKDVRRGFIPSTAMETAPTEVGAGSVAWARVLPAAYAAGVRHFYVEQEPPFSISPMEAAGRSFSYLSQLRA